MKRSSALVVLAPTLTLGFTAAVLQRQFYGGGTVRRDGAGAVITRDLHPYPHAAAAR